jgi:ABC-2 type transport system ATP-binding protein
MTPQDLLDLAGKLTGVPSSLRAKRSKELLLAVGMERWKKDRLGYFSKGMKQRVGLAQALMNDPDIVFLDEPTDGVDPLGRKDIRELILNLRARGKTVFVNSHLLGELEMICDRVAILCQGQVVRQGTLAELTQQGARYEVVAEGDLFQQEALVTVVRTLGGTVALTSDATQTLISIPTSRPQVVQPVIDELRRLGSVIHRVTPTRQSLEELFVDVVMTGGKPAPQSQPQPEATPLDL